jgi:predicted lactoylglutathione lyase
MATNIFVNLPVRDLQASIKFFTHLGYSFNQNYTDETATCMIVAENIYVMLLTEARFKEFYAETHGRRAHSTEVLVCRRWNHARRCRPWSPRPSKPAAAPTSEPQDHGFMYGHGYQDLDGHLWELV